MGTTLTGKLIADTYDALLKVTDNNVITGIKKRMTDGFGNDTPLLISTTDVQVDGNFLTEGVQFNVATAQTANTVGKLAWNHQDGTLDLRLKGGNVTLQIGEEQVSRVVNKTGVNLLEANYQVVRVDGAQGQRLKVALAQANNDANSAETLGIVTETINNNQEGFITTSGLVRGINTTGSLQGETWADGDMLYLSGTTAGRLTNIKPSAPTHTVIMGYVVHAHPTQGTIYVKVDNGYELNELHNVAISSPSNGQVLAYESATGLWKNSTNGNGTVTSVGLSAPTGFSVSGSPITSSGTLALSFSAGYSLPTTASQTNWDTAYTNRITSLTTTGSSGAATLISNTLNIPNYTLSGLGGVPTSRTLTINGTAYDLSADRSWTIATGVTSFNTRTGAVTLTSGDVTGALGYTPYNATNPNSYIALTALSASSPLSYNNTTGAFSIQQASGTQNGFLSSTDWTTFNNKQNALTNPITGTGSVSRVPRFLTSTTLGDSNIYTAADETIGLMTGIGGSPSLAPTPHIFYVTGNSYFNGTILTNNSITTSAGVTAGSFIRSGGTSAQLLAANGSVVTAGTNITISGGTISASNTSQWTTSGSNIYYNTGNVGIGTTSPATKFHINGGLTGNGIFIQVNGSSNTFLGNVSSWLGSGTDTNTALISYNSLIIGTNDTERMRITSGGNVGIGTTSPAYTLDVKGLTYITPASGYNVLFQNSGTTLRMNYLNDAGSANVSAAYRATDFAWQKGDGAETMRITSGGNVGIGTTNATNRLHVINASAGSEVVRVSDANNADFIIGFPSAGNVGLYAEYGTGGNFIFGTGTGRNERMRITSGGNVGIGTTSPNEKLSVIGAISANNGMIVQGYSAAASGLNCEMGVVSGYVQYNAYNRSTSAYGQFRLDGSSLILNAGSGGNVGIGTSSPGTKLQIGDGTASASQYFRIVNSGSDIYIGQSGGSIFGLTASSASLVLSDQASNPFGVGTTQAQPLVIGTNNTERMRITSAGSVGIGTSSPNAGLEINTSGGNIFIGGTTTNGYKLTVFKLTDTIAIENIKSGVGYKPLVLAPYGGEVGIGLNGSTFAYIGGSTIYNTSRLSIEMSTDQSGITTNANSSDTRYHLYFRNTLATVGSISTNSYATSFNTSSDYRLKEDYKPFNGLSILKDIKVYDFKWKGIEDRNYGVVAHEIEEVLPYVVNGEKDGEMYQSVDYSKLVPVLIQAIQELTEKVNKLENGI